MATDNILLKNRSPDYKVQITPPQQKTLTHLPKRPTVDLAFTSLKYTVRQGKGESICSLYFMVIDSIAINLTTLDIKLLILNYLQWCVVYTRFRHKSFISIVVNSCFFKKKKSIVYTSHLST